MNLKQTYENYDRTLRKLIHHLEVLEPIHAKERRKNITVDSLTSSVGDKELGKMLYTAGEKLGHLFLSKDALLTSLEEVAKYLQKVEQSPSQLIQIAITPTRNSLAQHGLLKHNDKEVRLVVSRCLSEIIRITTPETPYEDDKMKVVFQVIIESFDGLGEINSPSFSKRAMNLELMASVRSCVIMINLKCDELILQMF